MEIALVLVIVGLLVGLVLRAWELQVSARVRTLAAASQDIQVAYLGFIDRFHQVPGDWNAAAAGAAIGTSINGGGNDNGQLDHPAGAAAYSEVNALWEQMGKAGFISGTYAGTAATEPSASNNLAPMNIYNGVIIVGVTDDYQGAARTHLNVVIGRGLPVGVARELDLKLDDAAPETGSVRASPADAAVTVFAGTNNWGGQEGSCVYQPVAGPVSSKNKSPPPVGPSRWDTGARRQDCNVVTLF
jgi:hypothetical protein